MTWIEERYYGSPGPTGGMAEQVIFSKPPISTKEVGTINFLSGNDFPPPMTVRWTNSFIQDFTQEFQFFMTTDDGLRIFLNGNLVFNKWMNQPPTDYQMTLIIPKGQNKLVVEYYNDSGTGVVRVDMTVLRTIYDSTTGGTNPPPTTGTYTLAVDPTQLSSTQGTTGQLSAILKLNGVVVTNISPSDITWAISNPTIATLQSPSGLTNFVKFVTPGTAVVYVKWPKKGLQATVNITTIGSTGGGGTVPPPTGSGGTTPPPPVVNPPTGTNTPVNLRDIVQFSAISIDREYVKGTLRIIDPYEFTVKNISTNINVIVTFAGTGGVKFNPITFNLGPGLTQTVSVTFDSTEVEKLAEGLNTINNIVTLASNTSTTVPSNTVVQTPSINPATQPPSSGPTWKNGVTRQTEPGNPPAGWVLNSDGWWYPPTSGTPTTQSTGSLPPIAIQPTVGEWVRYQVSPERYETVSEFYSYVPANTQAAGPENNYVAGVYNTTYYIDRTYYYGPVYDYYLQGNADAAGTKPSREQPAKVLVKEGAPYITSNIYVGPVGGDPNVTTGSIVVPPPNIDPNQTFDKPPIIINDPLPPPPTSSITTVTGITGVSNTVDDMTDMGRFFKS